MHHPLADSAQHGTGVSAPSTGSKGPGPADQDPLQIFGNNSRPLSTEGEGKEHFFSTVEAALEPHKERSFPLEINKRIHISHHFVKSSCVIVFPVQRSSLHAFIRLQVSTVVQRCCVFSGQFCEGGNNEGSQSSPHLL